MINSKKFKFTTEKEIEYIIINDEVVVYKEIIFIDNKETEIAEGITTMHEIYNYNPQIGISKNSDYKLVDNEVVTLHRKCPIGLIEDNYLNKFEKLTIDNPFTFILKNKNYKENYDFYNFDYISETLTDLDGKIIPNAVYLDYMKGLHNGNFDLEKVLEYLKTRDDVRLLEDNILDIPSYNANYEDGKTKHLKIVWTPITYTLKENEKRTSSNTAFRVLELDKFLID